MAKSSLPKTSGYRGELKPLLPLAAAKDAFQRDYVNQVLERFAGNRTKAAEASASIQGQFFDTSKKKPSVARAEMNSIRMTILFIILHDSGHA